MELRANGTFSKSHGTFLNDISIGKYYRITNTVLRKNYYIESFESLKIKHFY